MKIRVQVKPSSKKPGIDKTNPELWVVWLRERAVEGQANKALLRELATDLKIARSRLHLLRGERSRIKTIMIYEDTHQENTHRKNTERAHEQ